MFLGPRAVHSTNAYVERSPEDRLPSFKAGIGLTVNGATLRYSTTSPAEDKKAKQTASAMAKVATASRKSV
ncbi:hypothetical protein [Streptomyces sp. DH10]|uniref:hypothetical protein n=1 Tax=Streptomyces sp. DH10 TaxID=3040121 RepID=UPI002443374A|nr:hypothetical protein [Streptomyces sp. DH10]MDG9711172.1 hypothetical protein [Streptomyces sp. DH10]